MSRFIVIQVQQKKSILKPQQACCYLIVRLNQEF